MTIKKTIPNVKTALGLILVLTAVGCSKKEDVTTTPVAPTPAPVAAPTIAAEEVIKGFLQCKKTYASGSTINFFTGLSEEKKSGYFIYGGYYPISYRMDLMQKSDTEYTYSLSSAVSVNNEPLDFRKLSINRQTLEISVMSVSLDGIDRVDRVNCNQDDFDITAMINDIKIKQQAFVDKKNAEELLRKQEVQKNTKF